MRLGRDVLDADLYAELGVLTDATESEIRVAYRRQVRASHPDLHADRPDAAARTKRLNVAARVLLDPSLRRAYDRAPRKAQRATNGAAATKRPAWYEQREQSSDDDWTAPSRAEREHRAHFAGFFRELRGRDARLGLRVQELIESLSGRQQLGVAALLCAVALALIALARPQGLVGNSVQPTSVSAGSVYP